MLTIKKTANTAHFVVWEPHPESKTSYLVKPQTDALRRPHTHGNTNISTNRQQRDRFKGKMDPVSCKFDTDVIQLFTFSAAIKLKLDNVAETLTAFLFQMMVSNIELTYNIPFKMLFKKFQKFGFLFKKESCSCCQLCLCCFETAYNLSPSLPSAATGYNSP